MKKRWFISKDSEYFKENEDTIKLENCPAGGEFCQLQMGFMNKNLLLAHKFVENKEFSRAVTLIKESYESTFDLKEEQCQKCAILFRDSILNILNNIIQDLEAMTKGIFSKGYQSDLLHAKRVLQFLKDKY